MQRSTTERSLYTGIKMDNFMRESALIDYCKNDAIVSTMRWLACPSP